jgi:hypothetical protein
MANSYLSKVFSSNGNRRTMAISFWLKRSNIGTETTIMGTGSTGSINSFIRFEASGALKIFDYNGQAGQWIVETSRKLLDCSSWYHLHFILDSTQSTAADRVQIWINGERITGLASPTYPNQNTDFNWNSAAQSWGIGVKRYGGSNSQFFDGQLAHINFVDGTASACTVFGETDSTTGEWKPKLSPSVTYGDEGFFLKFENAGALGTDSSGNSNTFTVNGNLKQSISTPSNLFNTLNANEGYITNIITAIKYAGTGWEDANTGADGIKGITGTLGMASGKWYYEMKYTSPAMYSNFGIAKANTLASSKLILDTQRAPWYQGNEGDGFGFRVGSTTPVIFRGDNTEVTWLTNSSDANSAISPATNGQICMCAFDLDAGKIWWGINGTWNTVPGSTTTTSSSQIASGSNAHKTWTPTGAFYRTGHSEYNRFGNASEQLLNFGEGRFGVTAVASGNADSAGEGVFEYAPPSGFLAICTKNIKNTG